jgi:hypothetical protein
VFAQRRLTALSGDVTQVDALGSVCRMDSCLRQAILWQKPLSTEHRGTSACTHHWLYRCWVQTQTCSNVVPFGRLVSRVVADGDMVRCGMPSTRRQGRQSWCACSCSPCAGLVERVQHVRHIAASLFQRTHCSGRSPLSACGAVIGSVSPQTGGGRGQGCLVEAHGQVLYSHALVAVHAALCLVCD